MAALCLPQPQCVPQHGWRSLLRLGICRVPYQTCCITLGGSAVLQAGQRWEMATVVAVTGGVYCNMLQGGLQTSESISSHLFGCASPQRAGVKECLWLFCIKHEAGTDLLVFSVGESASWWRAVCVFTHLTRKDSPNRLSTLTCFYY